MRSGPILFTVCLLSFATTKSWSFPFQNKFNAKAPASSALSLFRRSPLKARSVADERADECDCSSRYDDCPSSMPLPKQKGAVQSLRFTLVTDADGSIVQLGQKMGEGKSVVVFLRHLGDPYSWSYARDWGKLQRRLRRSGIVGPLFVSVGDTEKLQKFLELNRNIPRAQAFVDDHSLRAYESIGLGSMRFGRDLPEGVEIGAPRLGGVRGWWKYMKNGMELSPVEQGTKKFPEGVKQLGGTFVFDGNDVVYQWNDRCPGDTPIIDEVMSALASSVKP